MRSLPPGRRVLLPLAAALLAACAGAPRPSAVPAPVALPPIPEVQGPLSLRVVYPARDALVAARDSTFIFGSVGTGAARLTINGTPVEVKPNGAFLAFLPVPAEPRYELVATTEGDTARLVHPVRLLPPRVELSAAGGALVDTASLTPASGLALRPDELVRVSARVAPGASAALVLPDGRRPVALPVYDGPLHATDVQARALSEGARLVVTRGADTVRLAVPAVALADTGAAQWALLGGAGSAVDEGDVRVVGRPLPGGTYKWFFLPGTRVRVTGRSGDFVRVRLDPTLEAWVAAADVTPLPAGSAAPRRVVGNLRVRPDSEWVDVIFPVSERPPYLVEEEGETLALTLFGTTANTDIVNFAANDSLVRHVRWEQLREGRARYVLHLGERPFGYQVRWEDGSLVLRVRRPPVVDPERPLAGVRIAVDAGHPPIGATGPTGLYEAEAALAIARHVERLLAERGAVVTMTRTTDAPLALAERPIIARRADAHALVSIHLNALPDGVNPFTRHGTGTYYFHPHAAPLARSVQAGMVRRMGLRDLGTWYDNLALVRPTWMPAVLCEGAFLMIPEQEAALRTPEFQTAYALGVVEGLEAYFRGLRRDR